MTKKCGVKWLSPWNEEYECTRNKGHYGDHSQISYDRSPYGYYEHTFNFDKHCGFPLMGNSYRCEKSKNHKGLCKTWVFDKYVEFRVLAK